MKCFSSVITTGAVVVRMRCRHREALFVVSRHLLSLSIAMSSMVCEAIVSEDERQEEELDYEEEVVRKDEDKDEGELEDEDEDLEEGEVKEDSEDEQPTERDTGHEPPSDQTQAPPSQPSRGANSICRFFGRGKCTWGKNCRFIHPSGPQVSDARLSLGGRRSGGRDFGGGRQETGVGESESAWERGLKQAKEMLERAHRRKEEDVEFEEKRFHLTSGQSGRESPERERERESARDYEREDEYERRRRLAFESAPWNNEEPKFSGQRSGVAENYRDPWRRSKSPAKRSGQRSRGSMSSISGSESESASEFSDSQEESRESEFSSSSNTSERRSGRRRFNRKTSEKETKGAVAKPKVGQLARSDPKPSEETYDSWSESLSESESDVTSFYSEESQSEEQKEQRGRDAVTNKRVSKSKSGNEPMRKKQKVMANAMVKEEVKEQAVAKKSPIKMTFMKKQNLMKKENKLLNGRRVSREQEAEDREPEEELKEQVSPSGDKSLMATVSRREELLQQLRAVEDAIARKRGSKN